MLGHCFEGNIIDDMLYHDPFDQHLAQFHIVVKIIFGTKDVGEKLTLHA